MPAGSPERPFCSVWFDCDSTLTAVEGIDELGALRGPEVRARVARATERAMAGELPLAAVYGERLREIAPTRAECEALGERYVEELLPDAAAVLAALAAVGKRVCILSGGLRPAVLALGHALGLPDGQVFAVDLVFAPDGRYAGFDAASPLARNGGKLELLAARPADERPICLVGDGITDLEARGGVERFVGFGGVARRVAVEQGSELYTVEPRLAAVLPFVLTGDEQRALRSDPRFGGLFAER